MLIDTHAHIYSEYYGDKLAVINNAKNLGIDLIINNGVDSKSNQEVLANLSANVYGALGIHPENVAAYQPSDLDFIKNNLNNPRVVAIGEIGLDYHYSKDDREAQIELFETQLKLAEETNMPIIVHSRDATEDTINSLKKFHVKGVIHSFSGSLETAQIYLKMGFLLGVNGLVTFKNAKLKEVLAKLPLESLVLETDSPYLTPEPFRGQPNEPAKVYYTAKFLSEYLNISLEELAQITTQNALKIFPKIILKN